MALAGPRAHSSSLYYKHSNHSKPPLLHTCMTGGQPGCSEHMHSGRPLELAGRQPALSRSPVTLSTGYKASSRQLWTQHKDTGSGPGSRHQAPPSLQQGGLPAAQARPARAALYLLQVLGRRRRSNPIDDHIVTAWQCMSNRFQTLRATVPGAYAGALSAPPGCNEFAHAHTSNHGEQCADRSRTSTPACGPPGLKIQCMYADTVLVQPWSCLTRAAATLPCDNCHGGRAGDGL
jgi:hypothetical protein